MKHTLNLFIAITLLLFVRSSGEAADFKRGDCNNDGSLNIADAIWLLNSLFAGGPDPACADACDLNDDGRLDVGDVIYTLGALKVPGSPPPPPPHLFCGADPTDDELDCVTFSACP